VLSKTDTEYCQALRGLSGSASCLAHTSASMGFNIEFYTGNWASYIGRMDKDNHIMGSAYAAGESSLTFFGGLKPDTMSLYLTDIAHHHLALGVLLVLSAHLYSSLYKGFCGHAIADLLRASGNSAMIIPLSKSLHLQLSLACAGLAAIASLTAGQQAYSLGVYPYLSYDYVTTLALYLHHQYIGSFLMVASLVHAGIFFVRDYTVISRELHHSWGKCCASPEPLQREGGKKQDKYRSLSDGAVAKSSCFSRASGADTGRKAEMVPTGPISRILNTKAQLISHLSWACLYLGFHTLGVYIHNDTVVAFRAPAKQILIEPLTAINDACLSSRPANGASELYAPLSALPGDLLAHHAIALGLHVTTLILLKGSLDARGSRLMPDKINFALSFACDGPTRGGTCDISAWDSNYLAFFWMLNTDAWLMFYFHWKHLSIWQNTVFQFDESSTYLDGWFRDYLWFNSASLVNGYNAFGANDLSVLSWIFLGAHLVWATGFMFLISWRGYWQELIDIILLMHLKTPILYDLWNGGIYTPLALSIVQARFIGLAHFSAGFIFTYAAFVLGATA
jgi:photosystem I P700 chlorophyll a apoprotein A2